MRALWIEDHQLIGDSLELLLQVVLPDLSLDKAKTLAHAEQLVASIPFQLVLLDWWLETTDGTTAIAALRRAGCQAPIVVVSGDDREAVMRQAWSLGVAGYVRKSAEPQELIDTLNAVLAGQRAVLPPSVPSRDGLPALDVSTLFPSLTPRQADVYRAMVRGASDKQIARELGIGESTVKSHVRVILQTLGVGKRGEAAHLARGALNG
jgi:DNA-binding NarL/FixJ family response regulator